MLGFAELIIIAFVVFLFFSLIPFWVWMFKDCWQHERTGSDEKLYWLFVIVLLGPLGAGMYFMVRRKERVAKKGR